MESDVKSVPTAVVSLRVEEVFVVFTKTERVGSVLSQVASIRLTSSGITIPFLLIVAPVGYVPEEVIRDILVIPILGGQNMVTTT